jgi:sugar O-acyltransferase (sialic acid O-acetyltransferase NeuD family)
LDALAHLPMIKREDVQALIERKGVAHQSVPSDLVMVHGGRARLVIYGGGGHAKMCIDLIRAEQTFEIEGIVDPGLPVGAEVLGVRVLGGENVFPGLIRAGVRSAVLAVGAVTRHAMRSELYKMLVSNGFELPNIVHPRAVVEPSALMGRGNQIMAQAYIGSAVRLGDNCIINASSVVSHDCKLSDNVHLAPGCVLAGGVKVGSDSLIGMNASVYLKVTIGSRVVVANQVSVLADVSDGSFIRSA